VVIGGGQFLMSEEPLQGTCKTVKAKFWPWLSGKSPYNRLSCSLFARTRTASRGCVLYILPPYPRSPNAKTFTLIPEL